MYGKQLFELLSFLSITLDVTECLNVMFVKS